MNQQRTSFNFLKIFFITILWASNGLAEIPTRKSCLDHFLSGESISKVLPIANSDDDSKFYVECIFPLENMESEQMIGTKVHSALEKWHRIEPGKRETIGYQISDRKTLRNLVATSEVCSQEVWVQWPELTVLPEGQILGFTVESIEGNQRIFQRNLTLESYTEAVTLQTFLDGNSHDSALLHILGTDAKQNSENFTASIQLGPLICEQKIVSNVECLWEINEKSDLIKVSGISKGFIKFAFRTDKPEGPFLRILTENGSFLQMDLLDGYLLTVGHVVHPIKLLADGKWHTAKLDVKALTLQIDDSLPIIYLSAISSEKAVSEVEILLNGQITAIRGGLKDEWMCGISHAHVKADVTEQILRKFCPSYSPNFCKCQAPSSVLHKQECGRIDEKKAYQLDRSPNKLGFFYSPNFGEKSKVSIVFRSDSNIGLIFFGVANTIKSTTRVQTHFTGNRFFAASCTWSKSEHIEKCRSCSILRNSDSQNEWIRLSYFHYKDYSYMTVDGAICQLTPVQTASAEAHVMDGANLYEVKTTNKSALFVGGTFYSKKMNNAEIKQGFRRDFYENTKEKSPSLRGCIAEITVNGIREDLDILLYNQTTTISTNSNSQIFSIEKCRTCRVPVNQCEGAKCRSPSPLLGKPPICDCSSIFALQEESSGRCLAENEYSTFLKQRNYGGLSLTSSSSTKGLAILNRTTFTDTGKATLDRIWLLIRLPESNEEEKTILKIGSIEIKVGENGRKIIVNIDVDYSSHTFYIQNEDERLHLIAIKRNPSFFHIQVDNQIKELEIEANLILGKTDVIITPIIDTENTGAFPGCIAEFSVGYEYHEESTVQNDPHNFAHSVDLLNAIVFDIQRNGKPSEKSFIQYSACGIRDPSIWTSNSSSYGTVKEYDPYGDGESSAGFSIIITVIIVLLILFTLIFYCYYRYKKTSKKYRFNSQGHNLKVGKEEKTPLKDTFLDFSRSSTDLAPASPPVPSKANGDAPPSFPPYASPPNRVIVTEVNPEPLRLTDLEGSPKRFNRPIVQRIAPDGSPILPARASTTPLPRIISTTTTPKSSSNSTTTPRSVPIVIASQRAPIANVEDL